MPDAYGWQKDAYEAWRQSCFYGLLEAKTGAGKTLAGVLCLKSFLAEFPQTRPLVVTPRADNVKMWQAALAEQGVTGVPVMTYAAAANRVLRGGLQADCLVADECHHLVNQGWGAVLKAAPEAVLGLSATPEGSVGVLGEPFIKVGFDEARLCRFDIWLVAFRPTEEERAEYAKWSARMAHRAEEVAGQGVTNLPPGRDSKGWQCYDMLALRRRAACYTMRSRLVHAVKILKRNRGRRAMCFCERVKEAEALQSMLRDEGLFASLYTGRDNELTEFDTGRTDILIVVKKLREGYNNPAIEVAVLCAVTTGAVSNEQTIGRIIRYNPARPDKHADIYCLLADGTTDGRIRESLSYPQETLHRVQAASIEGGQTTL